MCARALCEEAIEEMIYGNLRLLCLLLAVAVVVCMQTFITPTVKDAKCKQKKQKIIITTTINTLCCNIQSISLFIVFLAAPKPDLTIAKERGFRSIFCGCDFFFVFFATWRYKKKTELLCLLDLSLFVAFYFSSSFSLLHTAITHTAAHNNALSSSA